MEPVAAAVVVTGLAAAVLGVAVVVRRRGRERPERSGEDYRTLFVLGTTYLPLGAAMMLVFIVNDLPWVVWMGMVALGATFLATGWAHRDEWRHR